MKPYVSVAAVGLSGLFAGCATYEPTSFTGSVKGAHCEPSQLGSGDRYYVTLHNGETGKEKTLVFQWPDSSRMCFTAGAAPALGSTLTVAMTNKFVNPEEPAYYVPQWAEITGGKP